MGYRTTSDLNLYMIMINGVYVTNITAKNSRSAIVAYCRLANIVVGKSISAGNCGMLMSYCSKSMNTGRRLCGSTGKCKPVYLANTNVGEIVAVPTPMGGIGM